MMFGFFATSVLLFLWVKFVVRRTSRKSQQEQESFWERERRANEVRKQSLDNLAFLEIPFDTLPFGALTDEKTLSDEAFIRTFVDKKTVNLTGISNTDLKLKYGAPNLTVLTEYDHNYTLLVRTMNAWAERLFNEHLEEESCTILEYLVQTGADTSITYLLLTQIYLNRKDFDSAERLIQIVTDSTFTLKKSMLRDMNLQMAGEFSYPKHQH